MQKREKQRPHYRYLPYEIEADTGDIWYRVLKYVNSFKKGEGFSGEQIEKHFKKKEHMTVFGFVHDIRAAGYLGVSGKTYPTKFIKLHDVPYHISREKFVKNNRGDMLWIESEILFKKE